MLSQAGLLQTSGDMPHADNNQPQTLGHVSGSDSSQTTPGQGQGQSNSGQALGASGSSSELQNKTDSSQSQAGHSQSLALSDEPGAAQSSQPGARSRAEGLPDDWDWESYIQLNPDVAAAGHRDPASAQQHWQEWGQFEKRRYKVGLHIGFRVDLGFRLG